MAGYVYTLEGDYGVYETFNNITSTWPNSISKAYQYPYKGFYGLLALGLKDYSLELYRGIFSRFDVSPGTYIRFNRFTSTSSNVKVARSFAGKSGTFFVIRGRKRAFYIGTGSAVPEEEEYLLSPHFQYKVVSVATRDIRIITMEVQHYVSESD